MTHDGSTATGVPRVTRVVRVTRTCRATGVCLAGALLAGCGHTEPFSSPPETRDNPFVPGPPARLTLNDGPDRSPGWLPDGSAILYSAQQLGRRDKDVCLALLPPTGGTQRSLTCDLSPGGADSTNAIESPAAGPDGRLAFLAASSGPGALLAFDQTIATAPLSDATALVPLVPVPYAVPGRPSDTRVERIRWLSATRLAWLGQGATFPVPCMRCPPDTLPVPHGIAWLDLTPGASPQQFPGGDGATGLSAGEGGDELYYTLVGDSRVYRGAVGGGAEVVHDFGPAGIARDVHVVGSRLVAVVGGRVAAGTDPQFGPVQWDSGGVIHVVDLASGTDAELPPGALFFRRPALSPAGDRVVAEGYPLIVTQIAEGIRDTTVSKTGDLYLFGGP